MRRNVNYSDKPVLIINADDLGLTESCTLATIEAFRASKISSSTMCSNGKFYDLAIKLIHEHCLSSRIGIHFNLTEGEPLTKGIKNDINFCTNGTFHGKIDRRMFLTKQSRSNVIGELAAQCERLIMSGITVTHADSHHHIHTVPGLFLVFHHVMKEYGIQKLRLTRNIGKIGFPKRILKDLSNLGLRFMGYHSASQFGSIMDIEHGINIHKSLEIMVHPDFNGSHELIDRRNYDEKMRPIGVELILDNDCLTNYRICSYYDGV